jgi:hypothetical protein
VSASQELARDFVRLFGWHRTKIPGYFFPNSRRVFALRLGKGAISNASILQIKLRLKGGNVSRIGIAPILPPIFAQNFPFSGV